MKKTIYTLGEEGVRKFKQLTSNKIGVGSRVVNKPQHAIDNYFPTPYQVQWAQSSGEKDANGNYKGTYIIWLPHNCLVVNGEPKISWGVAPAANYLTLHSPYWFDLASMLETDDSPYKEFPYRFQIWMQYTGDKVTFHFDDSKEKEISQRILIAQVINKNVIQHINSTITITEENKPFDIIARTHETPTQYRLVRNYFNFWNNQLSCPDVDLPSTVDGSYNIYLVGSIAQNLSSPEVTASYYIETKDLSAGPPQTTNTNTELHENIFYKKLYEYKIYYNELQVICDYRDADVDLSWLGVDNNTITDGKDGQLSNFLHLNNFYNTSSDVGVIQGAVDKILIKRGEGLSSHLYYATMESLKEALPEISADFDVKADNYSVSNGDDGQLSGFLHMNDFHNSNSDTTTFASCDFVLRTPVTNSELAGVSNKLEYLPANHFQDIIDDWIDLAITDAIDYEISETGIITEAIENALSGLSATSGSTGSFHYDQTTQYIRDGAVTIGRKPKLVPGTSAAAGYMSLKVTLDNSTGGTVEWVNENAFEKSYTGTVSYIPVYQFDSSLNIIGDYRGCFNVPCYDI